MATMVMNCVVPFPKDGIPCPACQKPQRRTSSFKEHARKVHKTLSIETPTTCSACNRCFDAFKKASTHYTRCKARPDLSLNPPSQTASTQSSPVPPMTAPRPTNCQPPIASPIPEHEPTPEPTTPEPTSPEHNHGQPPPSSPSIPPSRSPQSLLSQEIANQIRMQRFLSDCVSQPTQSTLPPLSPQSEGSNSANHLTTPPTPERASRPAPRSMQRRPTASDLFDRGNCSPPPHAPPPPTREGAGTTFLSNLRRDLLPLLEDSEPGTQPEQSIPPPPSTPRQPNALPVIPPRALNLQPQNNHPIPPPTSDP